ncbi:hypothetical protein V6N13_063977 [Hibiscus sabdariffa]
MVERTKKTSKDIPIELVGLMSGIIVAHCLMVLALTMMVKYNEVDVHSVYLVVFEQMGRKCAKYLVSICALRGMPTSSLTSRYKAIDSFFRTVENLEACCQIGVSKIVMASSVVLRLVLFTRLMYYTSLPILASIIPSAALSELIDINEGYRNRTIDELDFLAFLPLLLDKPIDHSNLEDKKEDNSSGRETIKILASIPIWELDWLNQCFVGQVKGMYVVDFFQQALRSDGFKVKVSVWSRCRLEERTRDLNESTVTTDSKKRGNVMIREKVEEVKGAPLSPSGGLTRKSVTRNGMEGTQFPWSHKTDGPFDIPIIKGLGL